MIPKYQAWHKAEKKMYSVLTLHLQEDGGIEVFDKWVTDFLTGEKDMATKFYQFDDIELRDCTEFKDKKAQEIYRGDILLYPYAITLVDQHVWPHKEIAISASDHKLVVQWEDGSFILRSTFDERWILLGVANIKEMEVIGNIYEHPEMLKGK